LTRADGIWALCVLGLACVVGALIASRVPLPLGPELPPVALLVAVGVVAALPFFIERWKLTLAVLLIWLVLEDLVRKLAGNNLTVYFVKDLIYALLLAGLWLSHTSGRTWRQAAGAARFALLGLVAWGVVMTLPTAVEDWRLPLVGLRLDFLYAPLVVAGYTLGLRQKNLGKWLVALSVLGGLAGLVGIAQAIIGPSFLAPEVPTPGLHNLVLVRGLPGSAPVYRPTGTFVDPGRFASVALLALATALAALMVARRGSRLLVASCCASSAAAVWVSGGRGGVVMASVLVVVAAIVSSLKNGRLHLGRALALGGLVVAAVGLFALLMPDLFSSRLSWYQRTLDPRSTENEWSFRWNSYSNDTRRGINLGGLIGQGTGRESLGKQYLYGQDYSGPEGLYQVEGGYASVAVEWGIVGLALWVTWSVAWVARQWVCVRSARSPSGSALGAVLIAWVALFLFAQFFGGLQSFQNYVPNAYFWLISGIIFALPHQGRERAMNSQRAVDSWFHG